MTIGKEILIAKEGDTVDSIAFDRFKRHGMEPAILEANLGLEALGPFIPIGTEVVIPAPEIRSRKETLRLFGRA